MNKKKKLDINDKITSQHITWHYGKVDEDAIHKRNGHLGVVIWLTGLSAAGKSTIAVELEYRLFNLGCQTALLDGDNLRHGLSSDLGFSEEDRRENIRRIGEISKLFCRAGIIVIASFISPYRNDRDRVRSILERNDFVEVFVDCPLDVCMERDPKGLYKKAQAGEIKNFTGIDAPYEKPLQPEIVIKSDLVTPSQSVDAILKFIKENNILLSGSPGMSLGGPRI